MKKTSVKLQFGSVKEQPRTKERSVFEDSDNEKEEDLVLQSGQQKPKLRQKPIKDCKGKSFEESEVDSLDAFLETISTMEADVAMEVLSDTDNVSVSDDESRIPVLSTTSKSHKKIKQEIISDSIPAVRSLYPLDLDSFDFQEIVEKTIKVRKELDIQSVEYIRKDGSYVNIPSYVPPYNDFDQFHFDKKLLSLITKDLKYMEPTPIQKQVVPYIYHGLDVIGIALTGSGKTATYSWPLIKHILSQTPLIKGQGPIGLIMVPTRELAIQVCKEIQSYTNIYGLRVEAFYGGVPKVKQFKIIKGSKVHILVCTPGRLLDLLKMKAFRLNRVSYLVLDECDELLNHGFEEQVKSICQLVNSSRQTLLFSATFSLKIQEIAKNHLFNDVIKVTVGNANRVNENIIQRGYVFRIKDDFKDKLRVATLEDLKHSKTNFTDKELDEKVLEFCDKSIIQQKTNFIIMYLKNKPIELLNISKIYKTIIFVAKKTQVSPLVNELSNEGINCIGLNGDMDQIERNEVIKTFRNDNEIVLISTDLSSRGLDIPEVSLVINFDAAGTLRTHIHRIGRTGRAGKSGIALTLLTEYNDEHFAAILAEQIINKSNSIENQDLEPGEITNDDSTDLINLALKNKWFYKKYRDIL